MSRWLAYGVGLTTVLCAALPAFRDASADSYPLSTYPMFARPRERPVLHFAEGVDAQGKAHKLAPRLVGSDEVMQAGATVRRAVEGGARAQKRLCKDIAARVAKSAHPEVTRVRLVRATFDPVAYFTETPEPVERAVRGECKVPRGGRR